MTSEGICITLMMILLTIEGAQARCPEGWVYDKDICYRLSEDPLTWIDSWTMCASFRARLVELDSTGKNNFIGSEIGRVGSGDDYWMGLSDVQEDGDWKWSFTGRRASYTLTSWDKNEPNGGTSENCATSNRFGKWNDMSCSNELKYICEKYAS